MTLRLEGERERERGRGRKRERGKERGWERERERGREMELMNLCCQVRENQGFAELQSIVLPLTSWVSGYDVIKFVCVSLNSPPYLTKYTLLSCKTIWIRDLPFLHFTFPANQETVVELISFFQRAVPPQLLGAAGAEGTTGEWSGEEREREEDVVDTVIEQVSIVAMYKQHVFL